MQAIAYFSAKTAMGTRRKCKLGALLTPYKTLYPAFALRYAHFAPCIYPPKSTPASVCAAQMDARHYEPASENTRKGVV
jgi:hypothetical protein